MDHVQNNYPQESLASILKLPAEILLHIISYLSSVDIWVNVQYVSRWFRSVVEGKPSLWKDVVWPYCDSHEECSVKELLKVYGQHIKMFSFPNCRVQSLTMVEMLQYCSNVQRLSLPSTKLGPEQLRKAIHHMECLQTLEFQLDDNNEAGYKQLLFQSSDLRELTVHAKRLKTFNFWKEGGFKPQRFNIVLPLKDNYIDYGYFTFRHLPVSTTVPTGSTATFRLYNGKSGKVPFNLSPIFPCLQLQFEVSGQGTPCGKLRDFGILGLEGDLVGMTNCQYSRRTMYMVKQITISVAKKLNAININDLSCATHFDISTAKQSLYSSHLEQLAIACRNLQQLNLQGCNHCLNSLQGLQAIASHCHNLQGLNLLGIHISEVEDHILFWEILSGIRLTHLAVEFCILRSEAVSKEKLISLYHKCWSIKGIQSSCNCSCWEFTKEDALLFSYFPSLIYCNLCAFSKLPNVVQDVIQNCKELKSIRFQHYSLHECLSMNFYECLSLNLGHNHSLQQLYIWSPYTDVSDEFITLVSAHGELVHVVMSIGSLAAEGIISLVRNSPKIITLHLYVRAIRHMDMSLQSFNTTLKQRFCNRKLVTGGHYLVDCQHYRDKFDVLQEQSTDLLPLW